MARGCLVCAHTEVDSINVALAEREPLKLISERFGVSESSVWRHGQNHLAPETSATIVQIRDQANALAAGVDHTAVYGIFAQTVVQAQSILDRAIANENDLLALKALKEVRDSASVLEKAVTRREGPSPDTEMEEQFNALTLALRRVLPDHRDTAKAIVAELNLMGALYLASTISNALLLDGKVE